MPCLGNFIVWCQFTSALPPGSCWKVPLPERWTIRSWSLDLPQDHSRVKIEKESLPWPQLAPQWDRLHWWSQNFPTSSVTRSFALTRLPLWHQKYRSRLIASLYSFILHGAPDWLRAVFCVYSIYQFYNLRFIIWDQSEIAPNDPSLDNYRSLTIKLW